MASIIVHRFLSEGLYHREATRPPLYTPRTMLFSALTLASVLFGMVLGAHSLWSWLDYDRDDRITTSLSAPIIFFHGLLPFGHDPSRNVASTPGDVRHSVCRTMEDALGDLQRQLYDHRRVTLRPCIERGATGGEVQAEQQQWEWRSVPHRGEALYNGATHTCLTALDGDESTDDAPLVSTLCATLGVGFNRTLLAASGALASTGAPWGCAQRSDRSLLFLQPCDAASAPQRFSLNATTRQLKSGASCITAALDGLGVLGQLRAMVSLPAALLPTHGKSWSHFLIYYALSPLFLYIVFCFTHHLNLTAADRGALNWARDMLTNLCCALVSLGALMGAVVYVALGTADALVALSLGIALLADELSLATFCAGMVLCIFGAYTVADLIRFTLLTAHMDTLGLSLAVATYFKCLFFFVAAIAGGGVSANVNAPAKFWWEAKVEALPVRGLRPYALPDGTVVAEKAHSIFNFGFVVAFCLCHSFAHAATALGNSAVDLIDGGPDTYGSLTTIAQVYYTVLDGADTLLRLGALFLYCLAGIRVVDSLDGIGTEWHDFLKFTWGGGKFDFTTFVRLLLEAVGDSIAHAFNALLNPWTNMCIFAVAVLSLVVVFGLDTTMCNCHFCLRRRLKRLQVLRITPTTDRPREPPHLGGSCNCLAAEAHEKVRVPDGHGGYRVDAQGQVAWVDAEFCRWHAPYFRARAPHELTEENKALGIRAGLPKFDEELFKMLERQRQRKVVDPAGVEEDSEDEGSDGGGGGEDAAPPPPRPRGGFKTAQEALAARVKEVAQAAQDGGAGAAREIAELKQKLPELHTAALHPRAVTGVAEALVAVACVPPMRRFMIYAGGMRLLLSLQAQHPDRLALKRAAVTALSELLAGDGEGDRRVDVGDALADLVREFDAGDMLAEAGRQDRAHPPIAHAAQAVLHAVGDGVGSPRSQGELLREAEGEKARLMAENERLRRNFEEQRAENAMLKNSGFMVRGGGKAAAPPPHPARSPRAIASHHTHTPHTPFSRALCSRRKG